MTTRAVVLVAMSLALASGALCAQQMYKWKDDQGVVHYSDTPPPPKEKKVEVKDFSAPSMTPAVPLPYALAQAVKNNPVTLYTTTQCAPCDEARALLRRRGVPYSEKTVVSNEDQLKLRQVSGDLQIPLLIVGRTKLRGFEPDGWQAALEAARYPETSKLPANYTFRPPEPAAPVVAEAPKPPPPQQPSQQPLPRIEPAKPPPPPNSNTPPGFRF